jgi:hypothetical protein
VFGPGREKDANDGVEADTLMKLSIEGSRSLKRASGVAISAARSAQATSSARATSSIRTLNIAILTTSSRYPIGMI